MLPAPMKVSVVTPVYNSERFLRETIESVLTQREEGVDIEYIIMDGGSTDGSLDIAASFGRAIDRVVTEKDQGPADAINKGLALASGDLLAWLNADDTYRPGALSRAVECLTLRPGCALCFGRCPIVDERGREIRQFITRFKEMFFPVSSRFTLQCINYISQPATLFRREAFRAAGPLRIDLTAAWDYDLFLRLWRQGGAARVRGTPLANFRWHEASISGQGFRRQFREEWDVARADAGRFSLQSLVHLGVRWGIVWSYSLMAHRRKSMKPGALNPEP